LTPFLIRETVFFAAIIALPMLAGFVADNLFACLGTTRKGDRSPTSSTTWLWPKPWPRCAGMRPTTTPTPVGPDRDILRALHEYLEGNADDGPLFQSVLPAIPEGMLDDYIRVMPTEFKRVLAIYDGHIAGSLDFDYCDAVATLYLRV
jgi:hypothetical protein